MGDASAGERFQLARASTLGRSRVRGASARARSRPSGPAARSPTPTAAAGGALPLYPRRGARVDERGERDPDLTSRRDAADGDRVARGHRNAGRRGDPPRSRRHRPRPRGADDPGHEVRQIPRAGGRADHDPGSARVPGPSRPAGPGRSNRGGVHLRRGHEVDLRQRASRVQADRRARRPAAALPSVPPEAARSETQLCRQHAARRLPGRNRDPGRMALLSTYLRHVHPGSTYWYLQAAPELLALGADRLENFEQGQR